MIGHVKNLNSSFVPIYTDQAAMRPFNAQYVVFCRSYKAGISPVTGLATGYGPVYSRILPGRRPGNRCGHLHLGAPLRGSS